MLVLVDKNLLRLENAAEVGPRYRLLETVSAYALEQLRTQDEYDLVVWNHVEYYLALTEKAAPLLAGPLQAIWLDRLEHEHDNLRAALARSLEHPSRPASALRLASALYRFWWMRGHVAEGRTWLARALDADAAGSQTKSVRLRALKASGVLAPQQGDYREAETFFSASLALAREVNESVAIADSLYWLGSTLRWLGDHQRALARLQQAWEVAAVTHARHLEIERAHPRIPGPIAVAVPLPIPFTSAFVALSPDVLGDLDLHQRLAEYPHAFPSEHPRHRLPPPCVPARPMPCSPCRPSSSVLPSLVSAIAMGTTRWPSLSTGHRWTFTHPCGHYHR
jgi:tetratricopeptide (TPR) repeat protein